MAEGHGKGLGTINLIGNGGRNVLVLALRVEYRFQLVQATKDIVIIKVACLNPIAKHSLVLETDVYE